MMWREKPARRYGVKATASKDNRYSIIRKKAGMSVEEMSSFLGISSATLECYERGAFPPPPSQEGKYSALNAGDTSTPNPRSPRGKRRPMSLEGTASQRMRRYLEANVGIQMCIADVAREVGASKASASFESGRFVRDGLAIKPRAGQIIWTGPIRPEE